MSGLLPYSKERGSKSGCDRPQRRGEATWNSRQTYIICADTSDTHLIQLKSIRYTPLLTAWNEEDRERMGKEKMIEKGTVYITGKAVDWTGPAVAAQQWALCIQVKIGRYTRTEHIRLPQHSMSKSKILVFVLQNTMFPSRTLFQHPLGRRGRRNQGLLLSFNGLMPTSLAVGLI
ncbi:hypothetical protein RND71_022932 [Anisodus tanguticus]|uniref:Uncharacterized protein n=1 Tax=Anisodus tanguticus TaxID=243964 RepID=A0AAE1V6J3_9SOLA|nr:hypothetical protein RND71_022932 [Anisodus tanguticus]